MDTEKLLEALDRSLTLVGRHRAAGHDLSNQKLVTDLGSLITNARRLRDLVIAPASEREQLSYLVRNAVTHDEVNKLMATVEDIQTSLADVSTGLDDQATQIAQLATQIAALVAGAVTQQQLDDLAAAASALAERAKGNAASIDALIEPDEGETPPTP
jgi:uncharacterized phage infection (PIP) family protein YhgE